MTQYICDIKILFLHKSNKDIRKWYKGIYDDDYFCVCNVVEYIHVASIVSWFLYIVYSMRVSVVAMIITTGAWSLESICWVWKWINFLLSILPFSVVKKLFFGLMLSLFRILFPLLLERWRVTNNITCLGLIIKKHLLEIQLNGVESMGSGALS